MLSLSMNIKVNAYILHCHDDAVDIGTAGYTGRISQTDSECSNQQAPCRLEQQDKLCLLSNKQQL